MLSSSSEERRIPDVCERGATTEGGKWPAALAVSTPATAPPAVRKLITASMHELSIALSMIEQIEEQASRHAGAVRSAQVKVGILSGVDCEALRFAWEIAREGTCLASTRLEIERIPVLVRCPSCGATRTAEVQSLACPTCLTPAQEILAGRELELTSIEMEES